MDFMTVAGGQAVDERGVLSFAQFPDGFAPKRMYWVRNHRTGFIRAWHGHKHESKLITCLAGAVLLGLATPDRWDHPSPLSPWTRITLSADHPRSLFIPAGYANGWMSLTDDALLLVFSDKTVDESRADDYRFPARLWDAWTVEER